MRLAFRAPPLAFAGDAQVGCCVIAVLESSDSRPHLAAPPPPAFVHIARQKAREWSSFADNLLPSGSSPPVSGSAHWLSGGAISKSHDSDPQPLLPEACANAESGGRSCQLRRRRGCML